MRECYFRGMTTQKKQTESVAATGDRGDEAAGQPAVAKPAPLPKEVGGPPGPEPTRYGDWQFKGRVTDF